MHAHHVPWPTHDHQPQPRTPLFYLRLLPLKQTSPAPPHLGRLLPLLLPACLLLLLLLLLPVLAAACLAAALPLAAAALLPVLAAAAAAATASLC